MKFQVSLYSGEHILLDDHQFANMKALWDAGVEEFNIGDQRLSRKAIASLGYTPGAAEQIKLERNAHYQSLPQPQQDELKKKELQMAMLAAEKKKQQLIMEGDFDRQRTWKKILGEEIKVNIGQREQIAPTAKEESGDAMYYLNEYGEKMYS